MPIPTLKVGSLGTHKALGLAKAKGARFLLASTSEVYGDPQVHPQPETYWGHVNPVGPRGVYDEAKRFAEAMTMAYHRYHGVDTRIVRIFNTYGPRMRPNDGRVVSNFIVQALTGAPLTIYGQGEQTRSFTYVDDLIDGIVRLLMHDDTGPSRTDARPTLGRHPTAATRRRGHPPAGQHRQPGRVHRRRACREGAGVDRQPAARSSTGRCRSTIRRCASRTSRRARALLGFEPRVPLDRASSGPSRTSRSRSPLPLGA